MSDAAYSNVGRNDECPCGSGRKFKRCHGLAPEPVGQAEGSKVATTGTVHSGSNPNGAKAPQDPFSQMDPEMMGEVMQALQRLPRGHLQKLQSIMQRAMAGQDVTREAMEIEKMLPPDVQQTLRKAQMSQMARMGLGAQAGASGATAGAPSSQDLSLEEAKRIVREAAASGKITEDQARELLKSQGTQTQNEIMDAEVISESPNTQGKKGFWSRITGK